MLHIIKAHSVLFAEVVQGDLLISHVEDRAPFGFLFRLYLFFYFFDRVFEQLLDLQFVLVFLQVASVRVVQLLLKVHDFALLLLKHALYVIVLFGLLVHVVFLQRSLHLLCDDRWHGVYCLQANQDCLQVLLLTKQNFVLLGDLTVS